MKFKLFKWTKGKQMDMDLDDYIEHLISEGWTSINTTVLKTATNGVEEWPTKVIIHCVEQK